MHDAYTLIQYFDNINISEFVSLLNSFTRKLYIHVVIIEKELLQWSIFVEAICKIGENRIIKKTNTE